MHEQEFYEINIIVKGSGMHYIKDNKILAKVGDVFIIPPFVPHGYYANESFDVFHLLLSNDFMNKYREDLQQIPGFFALFSAEPLMRSKTRTALHLTLDKGTMSRANGFLNALTTLTDYQNAYQCLNSSYTTMLFIMFLCEIYSSNFSFSKEMTKDECIMSTLSYIHEHYQEKITLNDLVKLSRMSRSSYINKFKEICKMPPLTYLTKTRIDVAEDLLTETDLPVSEIAFRTGFYDCSHFAKSFTAEKGVSPFQYKKTKHHNT
jgi:AraC-like DNA-binding protein